MSEIEDETRAKMRRTIAHELSRMEDDFDETRDIRKKLTNKLLESAAGVTLVDKQPDGTTTVREDTLAGIALINMSLKALADTEKAATTAINTKLKQSEQEIASSAAARDRVALMIKATAPGRIDVEIETADLGATLDEMFGAEISDFEMKTNPRDIDD